MVLPCSWSHTRFGAVAQRYSAFHRIPCMEVVTMNPTPPTTSRFALAVSPNGFCRSFMPMWLAGEHHLETFHPVVAGTDRLMAIPRHPPFSWTYTEIISDEDILEPPTPPRKLKKNRARNLAQRQRRVNISIDKNGVHIQKVPSAGPGRSAATATGSAPSAPHRPPHFGSSAHPETPVRCVRGQHPAQADGRRDAEEARRALEEATPRHPGGVETARNEARETAQGRQRHPSSHPHTRSANPSCRADHLVHPDLGHHQVHLQAIVKPRPRRFRRKPSCAGRRSNRIRTAQAPGRGSAWQPCRRR